MNDLHDLHELTRTWEDPAVREKIRNDPKQYAIDNGLLGEDSEVEIKLMVNPPNTMYIPLPHTDNTDTLSPDELQAMQAAGTASTGGTVGTASTTSTFAGTLATIGTASSLASAGSVES